MKQVRCARGDNSIAVITLQRSPGILSVPTASTQRRSQYQELGPWRRCKASRKNGDVVSWGWQCMSPELTFIVYPSSQILYLEKAGRACSHPLEPGIPSLYPQAQTLASGALWVKHRKAIPEDQGPWRGDLQKAIALAMEQVCGFLHNTPRPRQWETGHKEENAGAGVYHHVCSLHVL